MLSRRDWLRLAAATATAGVAPPWFRALAEGARPARGKACIVLWMGGGPAQTDTFDMKPDTPSAGEFKPIATNVTGIQVCEHLPRLAKQMDQLALLRGMSTGEADHMRASYYLQTGYRMLAGTLHPHLGALASAELGRTDFELPNFFWLGGPALAGGGFLGARHGPVLIPHVQEDGARNLENVRPGLDFPAFDRRAALLDRMEESFLAHQHGAVAVADHRAVYQSALRLMHSNKLRAFDLGKEPATVRDLYGATSFGKGCLLARRLVEVGVPFVGVSLGDFDTHNDNWPRLKALLPVVDRGLSALLSDLKQRGLLDTTLVIWMGEFGRDPRINSKGPKAGREHYARAWTTALAGAGLKTGQAVGGTDKLGHEVVERPVSVADFMATVCRALGIDFDKENTTPDGRPIRIAAKGANPVAELFG